MSETIDLAKAKSQFSELVNRASYRHERFVIRKRGRPVAAIVSLDDLTRLETEPRPRGLAAIVGLMADIPDWEETMAEVVASRAHRPDREVNLG